jgi:dihydroneopterin aldolase
MDKLTIKGLRFHGKHGVYEEEKIVGNEFEVDITFSRSFQKAGETDQLEDTIDYEKARNIVAEVMDEDSKNLIESLAFKIGSKLYIEFELEGLEVKVRKLNPPIEGEVDYSEVMMSWPR